MTKEDKTKFNKIYISSLLSAAREKELNGKLKKIADGLQALCWEIIGIFTYNDTFETEEILLKGLDMKKLSELDIFRTSPQGRQALIHALEKNKSFYLTWEECASDEASPIKDIKDVYSKIGYKADDKPEGIFIPLKADDKYVGSMHLITSQKKSCDDKYEITELFSRFTAHLIDEYRLKRKIENTSSHYMTVFENSHHTLVLLDQDAHIIICNKNFRELLGFKTRDHKEEVLNKYFDITEEKLLSALREALKNKEITTLEMIGLREQPEKRVTLHIKPQIIEGGSEFLEVEVEDLTSDIQLMRKAEDSEKRYRHLFDHASEGIALLNSDGIFLQVNQAGLDLIGYAKDQIIGHHYEQYLEDGLKDVVKKYFNRVLKGSALRAKYFRVLTKSGEKKPVSMSITPYKSENDEIQGVILMTYDRTPELKAFSAKERSEKEFRRIINNLQDIYYRCDPDDVIQYINPAASKILKHPDHKQLLGKKMIETLCVHQDDARESLKRIYREGMITNSPLLIRRYDGKEIYCEENSHVILGEDGKAIGHEGIIRDETKRREIEKALEYSEEQFRSLMKNIPIGVYRTTPDLKGKMIYLNPSFKKIFGYDSIEEMEKLVAVDLYYDPSQREKFIEQLKKEGELIDVEFKMKRKDGKAIWISDSCQVLRDENGEIQYLDGSLIDITDRKKLEAELQESEKLYRLLAENSHDVIWTLDLDLNYTYVSPSVKLLRGYEAKDLIGKSISKMLTQDSYKKVREAFDEQIRISRELSSEEQLKSMMMELELFKDNGSSIWVEVSAGFLRDEDNNPSGVLGVTRDISERKKAEMLIAEQLKTLDEKVKERTKELAKTNQLLVRSNRVKSEFLANISHELRSPLTAILGYTELLLGLDPDDKAYKEYLEIVSSQGGQLLRLVNSLLDIVKLEAGNIQLYLVETNVNDIVNLIEQHSRIKLEKVDIKLKRELDEKIKPCFLDSQKVYQVVRNLLDNAVKFSRRGSEIVITTKQTKDSILIRIKDSGIGIDEEKLEQIFQPFFQVDGSSTRNYEGAGLGLHLVKSYVELHEGKVTVESKLGEGSIFTIYLPFNLRPEIDVSSMIDKKADTEITLNGLKKKVLIVDDDDEISELVKIVLKNSYDVSSAVNGKMAIDKAIEFKPDIILMDLSMPVLDGYEATKALKKNPETKSIPVVALSARAMKSEIEKAFEAGCDGHITKPFKIRELQQTIKKHLLDNINKAQ